MVDTPITEAGIAGLAVGAAMVGYYPCARAQQRGRVIVLSVDRSVCLSVCLCAPSQDFEQSRLVYGLYLLRMSQKLKNINLYLPHERERTSGSRESRLSPFFGFVKTIF